MRFFYVTDTDFFPNDFTAYLTWAPKASCNLKIYPHLPECAIEIDSNLGRSSLQIPWRSSRRKVDVISIFRTNHQMHRPRLPCIRAECPVLVQGPLGASLPLKKDGPPSLSLPCDAISEDGVDRLRRGNFCKMLSSSYLLGNEDFHGAFLDFVCAWGFSERFSRPFRGFVRHRFRWTGILRDCDLSGLRHLETRHLPRDGKSLEAELFSISDPFFVADIARRIPGSSFVSRHRRADGSLLRRSTIELRRTEVSEKSESDSLRAL